MSEQAQRPATPINRIRRERTEQQLRGVISTLAHFIWNKQTRPGDHIWSIPVDEERDWDCILSDAIDELIELRAQRAVIVASSQALDVEAMRANLHATFNG